MPAAVGVSDPRFVAYVRQHLGRYPVESIRAALLKSGASPEAADAAIREATAPPPAAVEELPEIDVRMGAAERAVRKADRASDLAAEAAAEARKAFDPKGFFDLAKGVLTDPREFYRTMPPTGGVMPPLVFAGTMGALGGALQWAVTAALTGSPLAGFGGLVAGVVMVPAVSLIAGGFGFVFWRALGSPREFETAYRCCAYASAVAAAAAPASAIPYLGAPLALAGTAWYFYLLFLASVETHGIEERKAKTALAVVAALVLLAQASARFRAYRAYRAAHGSR